MSTDDDIDWRAVQWVASERIRMPLNRAERVEVVRRLVGRAKTQELAELLGVNIRQIERYKAELRSAERELVAS